MGVSGCGKTTIGKLLSRKVQLPFYDADDFHPKANINKMAIGLPLNDEDRLPWLKILGTQIKAWEKKGGAVLACSALKESYRKLLVTVPKDKIQFIYLSGSYNLIKEQIISRKNHFFDESLLQSQFDTLEIPKNAFQVSIEHSPDQIVQKITDYLKSDMNQKSEFGLIGLGVMGQNLALNFADQGIKLSVFNRHVAGLEEDIAKNFVENNQGKNLQGFDDLAAFIQSLQVPRKILFMVKAGDAVDNLIESMVNFLEKGDILIDGGNSHYLDTIRRIKHLKQQGINFIGTGISGGEEGARFGPSIIPGGAYKSYESIAPFLEKIAAKDKNGKPCCAYVGTEGSGHFVKMVHNGIEYAEMQLIAEAYELLRFGCQISPVEIATIFKNWSQAGLNSYLLEITIDILQKKEGDDFLLDKILDAAAQKGTGGWSTEAAISLGMPLNTISEAVMARNISALKELRVKASDIYSTSKTKLKVDKGLFINQLQNAFEAARIINHHIGFALIRAASKEFSWNINLSETARIWTNGCIIRSQLMENLVEILNENDQILLHPKVVEKLKMLKNDLVEIISISLKNGFPIPVFSSAMNYFLGFVNDNSSANLIQAQRDYFGAHTYKRVDHPDQSFHTNWKEK